jgi:hypothetical protein
MTKTHFRGPATVLALLLSTSAVSAQVTAQQVWDNWKAQSGLDSLPGVTIGSEAYNAGVLTVSDIAINFSDATGGAVGTIANVTLTEQADGTVLVTMAPLTELAITATDDSGSTTTMNLALEQTGVALTVSGTPEAMVYDVAATRYAFTMSDFVTDGAEVPGSIIVGVNDMSGSYSTQGSDNMMIDYDLAAASMDVLMDITDPTSGGDVNLTGKAENIAMTATGNLPIAELAATVQPEGLPEGLDIAGSYTLGNANYQFSAEGPMGATTGSISAASSAVTFDLSAAGMAYDVANSGVSLNLSGGEMPIPVSASVAELGMGMTIPGAPGDNQPFAASINITDLALNEDIWAMFDPGAVLPRDPATVRLDLTGMINVMANLFDPAAQEQMAMTGMPPAIPTALNLNEMLVSFGGASVSGTGALTFDPATLAAGGTPMPVGKVDVQINGVNGLMANLATMGLIPQDQIMMGQMMMGMFAVPTGDDQMTSAIEFTADGGILANGQRLQ